MRCKETADEQRNDQNDNQGNQGKPGAVSGDSGYRYPWRGTVFRVENNETGHDFG